VPPLAGALLAVLFWGVSFVVTKAVVGALSPVTLIFARSLLGTLTLVALLAARGELRVPPLGEWRYLAAMGFVGVAFHQVLQAWALTLTSATNTGWLVAITPLWSALLAALKLRERIGPMKVAGLLLGFAGAGAVVARGNPAGLLALPATRGDLLILLGTFNWAFYTVLGHGTIRRIGPARASAGALLVGTLLLLPLFAAGPGVSELVRLPPLGWAAIGFLGVACSGLGYYFWYGALEKVEASRVASLLYLEPLITMAGAVAFLHEPAALSTVAGGALLIAGVVLVQRARS
jgi:drug/metabolite transporter (DMT)-like permease